MDAAYLQKHVSGALTDALLAMTVQQPDDSVQFVGEYLIEYVRRQEEKKREAEEIKIAEELSLAEQARLEQIESDKKDEIVLRNKHEEKLRYFLRDLASDSKSSAMDAVTSFLADYLSVPAAYVAVKRVVDDNDVLYYSSSNESQRSLLVGKKLPKIDYDADEPVPRQGIAFDAFIVPEEEEIPVDEDADTENFQAPPPPKPQPLLVPNTMRETRIKFFSIPQLGSFLALPLRFESIDHDRGCEAAAAEEEPEPEGEERGAEETTEEADVATVDADAPAAEVVREVLYVAVRREVELLLWVDTVGRYRAIEEADVTVVTLVGEALVDRLMAVEEKTFAAHVKQLAKLTASLAAVEEVVATFAQQEVEALEAVERSMTIEIAVPIEGKDGEEGEGEDKTEGDGDGDEGQVDGEGQADGEVDEEEVVPESLRPYKDAIAVLDVWSRAFASTPLSTATLLLADHLLPAAPPVVALVRIVAALTGSPIDDMMDVFGEVTWEVLRTRIIPALPEAMASYDPAVARTVSPDMSLEALRASFEENNLSDAAQFGSELGVLRQVSGWAVKAMDARDKCIAYFAEIGTPVETVIGGGEEEEE